MGDIVLQVNNILQKSAYSKSSFDLRHFDQSQIGVKLFLGLLNLQNTQCIQKYEAGTCIPLLH